MRTVVYCTLRFEGFHRWPDAPPEHAYLRAEHRHEFHVRAEVQVNADRQVEFIDLKRRIAEGLRAKARAEDVRNWSCEQWARWLVDEFDLVACEVSEDGENGARVEA